MKKEIDYKKIPSNEMIALLQKMEKYKEILDELKLLEQKYFPQPEKPVKKTITIEKSLLIDIVKQITKCFKDYIKGHELRGLPIKIDELDMIRDNVINNIKDEEEDEEDIPDDEKNFYRKGGYDR